MMILPGDAGYDDLRKPLNPSLDPHPAAIVPAAGAADVRAAVLTARKYELPFAVQSTGHGTHVAYDNALLVRTGGMASVLIDPDRRVARVGPAARWGDVLRAAAPFGLAPLSGSSPDVGVTGYTLGGGLGWLARRYGLAADSVLRALVVTADGELEVATPDRNAELFWALRGGGGSFAVVTGLEFRLYPVARVFGGMSLYPVERAFETLSAYRQWALDEPAGMNSAVLLLRLPTGRRVLAIRAFHHGDPVEGRRVLAPLLDVAGPPLLDAFAVRAFPEASAATNGPDAPPMAHRQTIELFRALPDDAIDAMVEAGSPDSPLAFVEVRHWGGAMADPPPDAGPAGHRDMPFSVLAVGPHPAGDGHLDRLAERLAPQATGGSFLTLLTDPGKTRTAFTDANYARLAAVKRAWDPDNVFHLNHNIPPLKGTL